MIQVAHFDQPTHDDEDAEGAVRPDFVLQGRDLVIKDSLEQLGAINKVAIKRSPRNPGAFRDQFERNIMSPLAHDGPRRFDQAPSVFQTILAQGRFFLLRRLETGLPPFPSRRPVPSIHGPVVQGFGSAL
ncbi:hypothetical protein V5F29_18950 [Xanthobacter aminoxidans]